MAKKVQAYIRLQVPAGKANPSPPVGPALGQHGVNIMEFCKAFNADTQGMEVGMPVPVVITVYSDRSFTFIKKTPPAAVLLRKAAKYRKRQRGAEHHEGRQGDARAGRRDRASEDARPDGGRNGSRSAHDRRQRAQCRYRRGGTLTWRNYRNA